jgi:hypothetical protein
MTAALRLVQPALIERTSVLARGWTPAAIRKYLGEPDDCEDRRCRYGTYQVHHYLEHRVHAAEQTSEWQKWHQSLLKRRAKKAEEERRQRIRYERAALRSKPQPDLDARLKAFKAARPAVLIDLMDALQEITREAKRARDASQAAYQRRAYDSATACSREKQRLYDLKSQAIAHLMRDGALKHIEHHSFSGRWASLVSPPGRPEIRLHVPCAPIEGVEPLLDLGEMIPARESTEVRAKDAVYSVERYLEGRPPLPVYSWPTPARPARVQECYGCGGEWLYGECLDGCGRGSW